MGGSWRTRLRGRGKNRDSMPTTDRTNSQARHVRLVSGRLVAFCFSSALVLSLLSAAECHVFVRQLAAGIALMPSLVYGASVWLWWAPLTVTIACGVERTEWFGKLSPGVVPLQVTCAIALACFHLRLLMFCVHLLVRRWPMLWNAGYKALPLWSWQRAMPEVLLYLLVWAAATAIYQRRATLAKQLEALDLRKSLTEAELSALQRQMQPHFLLNTLNSITGLLESGDNQTALEVVGRLSVLTKRTLTQDLPTLVAVKDELAMAEAYLAIEEMRFGDRLQVEISIEPGVLTQRMPPFILQPLVENAIKHSVRQDRDGCLVRIWLSHQDERVHLRVVDNGLGAESSAIPGMGISIENIRSRLRLLYRGEFHLEMRSAAQGGCEVNVSFPVETLHA